MAVTEGRESASRGRGGPSLPTWCKSRSGPAWSAARPRHHDRSLHALARPRRPAAQQGAPHSEARPPRPSPSPRASPSRRQRGGGASGAAARKPLAHDPDFLAAGILFALMISVLAGVLAAMLVADSERAADLPGNKSVGSGALREAVLRARRSADVGLDEDAVGEDVLAEGFTGLAGLAAPREDEDDDAVPDYLLDLLQSHRNQERLGEDFILGYHDDYRERYDGFDQPPPFRRRRHKRASTEPAAAEAAARRTLRASDLEISEEEAFSTRVFVTTPRRQR